MGSCFMLGSIYIGMIDKSFLFYFVGVFGRLKGRHLALFL